MSKRIKWTKEMDNDIVTRFNNGEKLCQIAKLYDCNYISIRRRLKKLIEYKNTYNLKSKCNESYFSKIDTKDKAYFLGLMYADGCVRDAKNRSKQLMIELNYKDVGILQQFKEYLNFSGKLQFYDKTGKFFHFRGKTYKQNNTYRLTVSSNQLCGDLIKLGCTPRKTKTLKFPSRDIVPDNLLPYFVLGYFDGDGYVSVTTTKDTHKQRISFGFNSTLPFLKGIRKFLFKTMNFNPKILKVTGCYIVHYTGEKKANIFKSLVYKDMKVFLKRKQEKFLLV